MLLLILALAFGLTAGCQTNFGRGAEHGLVVYIPGAGNVDRGEVGLQEGLQRVGFRGAFVTLRWTYSYNVALDQSVRAFARIAATRLAGLLQDYMDRYPDREVNVVGLSAGTGIAIWAVEQLQPGYKVNNVVLLSSSLATDYDVGPALEHMSGRIYNYYSMTDAVLIGPMKVFGTIEGRYLVDGAGAVGLEPATPTDRVVNTPWTPDFEQYGYVGGHFDVTSPAFVQTFISKHLVNDEMVTKPDTASASLTATTAPDAGHR
jgi:pimeloyl-ACP methyl ester carboxylesterase